jgi:hypothetical protein
MKAKCASGTVVSFSGQKWRHIPQYGSLYNRPTDIIRTLLTNILYPGYKSVFIQGQQIHRFDGPRKAILFERKNLNCISYECRRNIVIRTENEARKCLEFAQNLQGSSFRFTQQYFKKSLQHEFWILYTNYLSEEGFGVPCFVAHNKTYNYGQHLAVDIRN